MSPSDINFSSILYKLDQGLIYSYLLWSHSHHPLSSLITCIHHTIVPEHLFGAEYECVRHPLCLSSSHHCDIYFDCHFSSIYSYHGHILMNSSSHIVIIIICLNLLQTRISYLNHLAIFPFRVTLSQHHPLVGFSSSKFAPNKEETSCWWSHSKVYMPNKEEPLVGFSQNVCRARAYASCWLFPKSLKVYAEQGRTSCWLFFSKISQSVCA